MVSFLCYQFLFSLVITSALAISTNRSKFPETILLAELFGPDYDPRTRPTLDPTQPIHVDLRLILNQIYQVNERAQTVSILSEMNQMWRDPSFCWDTSEYGGLKSFSVFYTTIWTPDTMLYNTAELYRPNVEDRENAKVLWDENTTSQGAVIEYTYKVHYTIICRFNMAYFPFDIQNCTFEIGSWTYDESQVHYIIINEGSISQEYYASQEWDLISFDLETISVKYVCCDEKYQTIFIHLVIRRKSLFYIFNLILPTIIINIMGSFALFSSHGNEHNRHDKLQIGITTLLSYCILLLSVSDQIPHASSSIPLISWFFFGVMVQNALKMYMAIYLSYPNRRLYLRKLWEQLKQKATRMTVTTNMKINQIDEEDMWEELVCLQFSVLGLVLIIAAMFAVAYSQPGIWDHAQG